MPNAEIFDRKSLIREMFIRYRGGEYGDALMLVEKHADLLSDDVERDWYRTALRARAGDRAGSMRVLRSALDRGAWFDESMLQDSDFDQLREDPDFKDLYSRSVALKRQAATQARPELQLLVPGTPAPAHGYPLLVTLHGNSSNAALTAHEWAGATARGWLVAAPQSSQVGRRHGVFVWNDSNLATLELKAQLAAIERSHPVDWTRFIFGGFSLGAFQAALMVLQRQAANQGFVMVSPGMPTPEPLLEAARNIDPRSVRGYVLLGGDDAPQAIENARRLVAALNDTGIRTQLDERPGLGHEYPNDFETTLEGALEFVLQR